MEIILNELGKLCNIYRPLEGILDTLVVPNFDIAVF
jgi:hypothetical protein